MATEWSDEELRASIEAYLDMMQLHRGGKPFVKASIYRDLSSRFGRTDSAFERRMMNISSVLSILGREWLPGLLPAKNVGTNIAPRIERLIAEVEGKQTIPVVQFEAEVLDNIERPSMERPEGSAAPKKSITPVTSFARDPAVKAWVLRRANGKCESCLEDAPFITTEGYPFLEVHHLKTLADGGSDRVSNAAALCPNCHRRFHFAGDKAKLRDKLYIRIDRLIPE
jgi:5-methylcytosine-specific restriction protein A